MKKIIRILNLDIHSLNNAEYKNFMERFFKLIPLKAVSGEGDRPSELRLLGEEENMTSDFVRDWLTTSVRRSMSALNVALSSSLIPTKSDVMFSSPPIRVRSWKGC